MTSIVLLWNSPDVLPGKMHILRKWLLKEKLLVNNVDRSSLRAPLQNSKMARTKTNTDLNLIIVKLCLMCNGYSLLYTKEGI